MIVGVPKETFPGERRVAVVPSVVPALTKASLDVLIESSAGTAAGFPDAAYTDAGARVAASRAQLFADADIVLQVRSPGVAGDAGRADLELLRPSQAILGLSDPLGEPAAAHGRWPSGASHRVLYGADPPHHPGAEHGRALIDGDRRRLQGGAARCRGASPDVPDDDDGGRHHYARPKYSSSGPASRDFRRSRRRAGSARVSRRTMSVPPSRNRSRASARHSSSCRSRPRAPRTRVATRRRRTSRSTGGNARRWCASSRPATS